MLTQILSITRPSVKIQNTLKTKNTDRFKETELWDPKFLEIFTLLISKIHIHKYLPVLFNAHVFFDNIKNKYIFFPLFKRLEEILSHQMLQRFDKYLSGKHREF